MSLAPNVLTRRANIVYAFYFAEHPVVIAELLVLDVVVAQLVHCAQAVAGQHVDVDVVVGAAEHPDEDVVVVDDVVGAFAEQPCGTEVVVVVGVAVAVVVVVIVVEVDDVCATTPTTPTIESATAAATRKTAIFFMLYLSFLGNFPYDTPELGSKVIFPSDSYEICPKSDSSATVIYIRTEPSSFLDDGFKSWRGGFTVPSNVRACPRAVLLSFATLTTS